MARVRARIPGIGLVTTTTELADERGWKTYPDMPVVNQNGKPIPPKYNAPQLRGVKDADAAPETKAEQATNEKKE